VSDADVTAIIGAGGVLINAIGLAFVAIQVILARRQLLHAQRVNEVETARMKRQATIDFYMTTVEQRTGWRSILPDDWDAAAIEQFIKSAYTEQGPRKLQVIVDYLGYFEALAVAVASDVYDIETLDSIAGSRIRRIATNYKPFFERARVAANAPSLYVELEWLGEQLETLRASSSQYILLAERKRLPAS
jgi:hypothetical protein